MAYKAHAQELQNLVVMILFCQGFGNGVFVQLAQSIERKSAIPRAEAVPIFSNVPMALPRAAYHYF